MSVEVSVVIRAKCSVHEGGTVVCEVATGMVVIRASKALVNASRSVGERCGVVGTGIDGSWELNDGNACESGAGERAGRVEVADAGSKRSRSMKDSVM